MSQITVKFIIWKSNCKSICWNLLPDYLQISVCMMTSSNGNIFHVTGHLCVEFTGLRWIPRTMASDAELWCFLSSASIISKPSVTSNWSYTPETLNSPQNRRFYVLCDLEIWRMTLKNNRAPLLCCSSLVHHFIAIGEFKLELQSRNALFG